MHLLCEISSCNRARSENVTRGHAPCAPPSFPAKSKAGALNHMHTVQKSDAGLVYTQELALRISFFLGVCDWSRVAGERCSRRRKRAHHSPPGASGAGTFIRVTFCPRQRYQCDREKYRLSA